MSKRLEQYKENYFPSLVREGYCVTSDETSEYNCIAWAAGKQNTDQWWDPFQMGNGYFWPPSLPKDDEVSTFIKLYELTGSFVTCADGQLEEGFEKIAIYVGHDGKVTHAARQTSDGSWTSKLGTWEDIRHETVEGLYSDEYGTVGQYMKRSNVVTATTNLVQAEPA